MRRAWFLPAIKPRQIKALRERHRVSQPVFARYLNTSESTVEKWETGAKKPQRHGAEAAGSGAETWTEDARLNGDSLQWKRC